jgi:23S rRNA (uracil1939-C5)-methyltransferase
VFDLYSGAGTISLLLAQRAAYVYGVESSPQATEDARHNAQLNGLDNVSFIADTAENALPRLIREGVKPDIIVLDPPRKGAGVTVIDAIAAALPERVVYVSCNPATQARDAARLVSHGYRVTACQGTDMFCQTADIENVLLFER